MSVHPASKKQTESTPPTRNIDKDYEKDSRCCDIPRCISIPTPTSSNISDWNHRKNELIAHPKKSRTHEEPVGVPEAQAPESEILTGIGKAPYDLTLLPGLQYSGSFNSSARSTHTRNSVTKEQADQSQPGHFRSLSNTTPPHHPSSSTKVPTIAWGGIQHSKAGKIPLSPHASLIDLIQASKSLEEDIRTSSRQSQIPGSSATPKSMDKSPARPDNLRYKAKTTGHISSEDRKQYYASLQPTASGSMLPVPSTAGHYRNVSNISNNSSSIGVTPTLHSVLNTTMNNMNPFEDPSIIGDLNNMNIGESNASNGKSFNASAPSHSSSAANPSTTPEHASAAQNHPLQTPDGGRLAQFDPLQSTHNSYKQTDTSGHSRGMTLDTSELSAIAAQLSTLKPQQNQNSDHIITLGEAPKESTGTAKSHRRFLSLQVGNGQNGGTSNDKKSSMREHRRSGSMGLFKRGDGSGNKDIDRPKTPVTRRRGKSSNTRDIDRPKTPLSLKRGKSSNSPNKTAADDRPTTSDSNTSRGRVRAGKSPGRRSKLGLRLKGRDAQTPSTSPGRQPQPREAHQSDIIDNQNVPSSRSPNTEIKLRTSEQDPNLHQISIPPVTEMLTNARLCHLFENYREIDQNFDFGVLTSLSRQDMVNFVGKEFTSNTINNALTPQGVNVMNNTHPSMSTTRAQHSMLIEAHKPIINSILSCGDDLIVSGFYHESSDGENNVTHDTLNEKSTRDRIEATIFASDVHRQFIVVFQGSSESQAKPIKRFTSRFQANEEKNFGTEEPVSVFPPFERAYTQSGLEDKVFAKLDELAEEHPFFDVIMTGHSYGAAMALLGSMKYACSRPVMMVSCHAFGCPKVGRLDFRHYVNSLPNLKVMRLENGYDPWVKTPDNPAWAHAGHTISLSQPLATKSSKGGNERGNKDNKQSANGDSAQASNKMEVLNMPLVRAYKFGDDRPDTAGSGKFIGKIVSKANRQEKQVDHDIATYVHVIDRIAGEGVSWPKHFVGEEGTGVQGLNKEKRLVC